MNINHLLMQANSTSDLVTLYNLLKDHYIIGVLVLVIYLVFKYAPQLGTYFKEYFGKRTDMETKRFEELTKVNDRHFALYENNTKAVEKIGEAIVSFEKAFIGSESRTGERISGVETRLIEKIGTVEDKIIDKFTTSVKDIVQADKIDKINEKISGKEKSHGDIK